VRQRAVEQRVPCGIPPGGPCLCSGTVLSVDTAHRVTIALGAPLVPYGETLESIVNEVN
jgi:hypothetical protein